MLWKNRNKRKGLCVFVLTACVVVASIWGWLATSDTALAKGKPPGKGGGGEVGQEIPVCIAFDNDLSIQNDGGGNYCDGESRKKVTAGVGRNFSIQFEPNNSNKTNAGRTVWLDLSYALGADSVKVDITDGAGGGSDGICDTIVPGIPDLPTSRFGTPIPGQKYGFPDNVKLVIAGRDLDGLLVGKTVDTNARLSFSVGGENWEVYWGPHKSGGGWTYAPGTTPVTVTRDDNDTWRIESLVGEACLYRENNPPQRATEYHGQIIVPFSLTAEAMVPEETVWGDEPHGINLGDDPCQVVP